MKLKQEAAAIEIRSMEKASVKQHDGPIKVSRCEKCRSAESYRYLFDLRCMNWAT